MIDTFIIGFFCIVLYFLMGCFLFLSQYLIDSNIKHYSKYLRGGMILLWPLYYGSLLLRFILLSIWAVLTDIYSTYNKR